MADQILVLDDGRIIEAGGHDELVGMGGRYAALYEMQAGQISIGSVTGPISFQAQRMQAGSAQTFATLVLNSYRA